MIDILLIVLMWALRIAGVVGLLILGSILLALIVDGFRNPPAERPTDLYIVHDDKKESFDEVC